MSNNLRKKILLIDDDPNIIQLYASVFHEAGFDTLVARNGQEGLEKAKNEAPSLILLDLKMPGMSGFDVLQKLKEDDSTSATPVFIISNYPEGENLEKAKKLGAEDFLIKSQHTPNQISRKIQIFFENLGSPQAEKESSE